MGKTETGPVEYESIPVGTDMKTPLTALAGACFLLLLAGCSPGDREAETERGENLKEKSSGAAEKLTRNAKDLGSKIETEARNVGAMPESGREQSPEQKVRRGAAALKQEGKEARAKLSQAAQTAKVKYNLTAALGLAGASHIDVESNGNTVTLRGTVSSADQKADAERGALATDGVTKVINLLGVKP